jgi:hypothetical protein
MDPVHALAHARKALAAMRESQREGDTHGQLVAGHQLADAFEDLNNWLGGIADVHTEDELTGVIVSYAESCDHNTLRTSLAGIPEGHIVTATLRDGTSVEAQTVGFTTDESGEMMFSYRRWDEDDGAGEDVRSVSVNDLVEIRVF